MQVAFCKPDATVDDALKQETADGRDSDAAIMPKNRQEYCTGLEAYYQHRTVPYVVSVNVDVGMFNEQRLITNIIPLACTIITGMITVVARAS